METGALQAKIPEPRNMQITSNYRTRQPIAMWIMASIGTWQRRQEQRLLNCWNTSKGQWFNALHCSACSSISNTRLVGLPWPYGTSRHKVKVLESQGVQMRPAFWVGNVESLVGKCPCDVRHQTWSVHGVSHEPEQHRPSGSDTLEAMCLSQSKGRNIRKVKSSYLRSHHVNDCQCLLMVEVLAQSILWITSMIVRSLRSGSTLKRSKIYSVCWIVLDGLSCTQRWMATMRADIWRLFFAGRKGFYSTWSCFKVTKMVETQLE